jgi:hypothetical protein
MQGIPYDYFMDAVASMCMASWHPKSQSYISMAYGLAGYLSHKVAYVLLTSRGESCIPNELTSISPNMRSRGTIQVLNVVPGGRFSARIGHPIVFDLSHHLHRIPGVGDSIILGIGCGLGAFLCAGKFTAFHAVAVPDLIPFLLAIKTGRFTLALLILVTLVTFPGLPATERL